MTREENLLYFKMQMLQAEIEMNGMIAENKYRESIGQSIAYGEESFAHIIKKYDILHNAFMEMIQNNYK